MNLSDRLRTIVKAPRRDAPPPVRPPSAPRAIEDALRGEWHERHGARLFVVERRWAAGEVHGTARIGDLADRLHGDCTDAASLSASSRHVPPPFLFFDLETTGLSGGAGTYAFLIGCGWFDGDGAFVARQYLLAEHGGERAMLLALAEDLARSGTLVSFNGRSFDAPVVETRCAFHRIDWAGAGRPHLDVLHPARRFWGGEQECSLVALEQQILGLRRDGDVPGFEIPERYFNYLRSGDAQPLAGVLEHNQLDLLSLAAISARLVDLVGRGPAATLDAREALGLGGVYARVGGEARAREAYERAVGLALASGRPSVLVPALRSLALLERRARRFDAAAERWRQVLDVRGCPPHVAREAAEALAIHAEHRARDLASARSFALRSLGADARRGWNDAVRHRLARIDRKLSGDAGRGLLEGT